MVKAQCPPPRLAGALAAPARRGLRPGCGPVRGSAGMLDESGGVGALLLSRSHAAFPPQAGVTLWFSTPCSHPLCLPRSPPEPGSPAAFGAPRRRMLRAGDGTAPSPHSRRSGESRGQHDIPGVASSPSGFQGSLETFLLGRSSEFLPELHKCLSFGQSERPSLTSQHLLQVSGC